MNSTKSLFNFYNHSELTTVKAMNISFLCRTKDKRHLFDITLIGASPFVKMFPHKYGLVCLHVVCVKFFSYLHGGQPYMCRWQGKVNLMKGERSQQTPSATLLSAESCSKRCYILTQIPPDVVDP